MVAPLRLILPHCWYNLPLKIQGGSVQLFTLPMVSGIQAFCPNTPGDMVCENEFFTRASKMKVKPTRHTRFKFVMWFVLVNCSGYFFAAPACTKTCSSHSFYPSGPGFCSPGHRLSAFGYFFCLLTDTLYKTDIPT